ncbi:ABC transporter permease [Acutalibacter caecimuris]|uniref:ABC transporter permease n=1 Tax=Acutalibacter caecimuris TaxID=3093657 RepID=UPI002AC9ED86|nr:ABC transporter permease subunit [Acutalibacter sp. M00118]
MKTISTARKKPLLVRLKRYWPLYVMLIPGFIYLIINNYLPMGGLVIAFKKVNYSIGILESPWAGLNNFSFIFSTNDAYIMFRNTILYNLAFIILGNVFGLLVAIALDTVKQKFLKNFSQIIILIPYLLSIVIVTYIVFAFLSPSNGFVNNSILAPLGIDRVEWYNEPGPWPVILTIVYLWMSFGYTSILYYSTLIGIERTMYEAAVIDGAGVWKQILHVTLPCMKKTIIILMILAVGRICYSDFGLFYQVPMHSGMLYSTTQTIDTFVYRALLEQNSIGRSAAAGFLQSVLGFVLVITANAVVSKLDKESALI